MNDFTAYCTFMAHSWSALVQEIIVIQLKFSMVGDSNLGVRK